MGSGVSVSGRRLVASDAMYLGRDNADPESFPAMVAEIESWWNAP
jgi:hypothetical protein